MSNVLMQVVDQLRDGKLKVVDLTQPLVRDLHRSYEHVTGSELLDEIQGLALGTGSDGEHGDHRSDTEDDAESCQ